MTALALVKQDLECGICLDLYERPVTLACGHSLCEGCAKRMVGTEKNGSACIRCAHCRAKTRWKSGKANLKVNIALQNMVERLKKAQKQEEKERNAEERRRRRMREKEKPEKGEVNTKEEGPEAVEKEEEVVVLVVEEEEAEEDRQEAKDMADALKKAELVRSSSLLSSSSSSSSSSSAASNPSDGVPPTSPQRPTEGRRGSTAPHSPFENNGMAEEEEEEEDAIITNPDAMAAFEAALATSFTQEQQLPVLGTGAVPESFAGEHWASSGLEADGVQFQSSRERNAAKGKERSQSRHHAGNDLGWEALHRRLSRSNRDSSTINSLSRADLDNRSRSQEDRHGSSRKSGKQNITVVYEGIPEEYYQMLAGHSGPIRQVEEATKSKIEATSQQGVHGISISGSPDDVHRARRHLVELIREASFQHASTSSNGESKRVPDSAPAPAASGSSSSPLVKKKMSISRRQYDLLLSNDLQLLHSIETTTDTSLIFPSNASSYSGSVPITISGRREGVNITTDFLKANEEAAERLSPPTENERPLCRSQSVSARSSHSSSHGRRRRRRQIPATEGRVPGCTVA